MVKIRVLLAEDDADHQRLLVRSLAGGARAGVRVEASLVADTKGLLDALRSECFDCVVIDFSLGADAAPEVIRQARPLAPATPFIVVSSCEDQRVVIECLRHGVADFIPKESVIGGGGGRGGLVEAIEGAIERARLERAERRRFNRRVRLLQRQTETDHLTGLLNRRFAERILSPDRRKADRRALTACIALDIDHFKAVNDRLGHSAGDNVLRSVAGVLSRAAEGGDAVIRWGGEEFLVLKPSASQTAAWVWAENVRRAVETQLSGSGAAPGCTVSAGVFSVPTGDLGESAIGLADRALYLAKDLGRNRVCTWNMAAALELAHEVQLHEPGDAVAAAREYLRRLAPVLGPVQSRQMGEHSREVRALAEQIGTLMGLSRLDLEDLCTASLHHDIGKVAVPEDVLAKPATLAPGERLFIAAHMHFGAEILRALGAAARVAEVVAVHHGARDGCALAEDPAVARMARVLAVADAVAAMRGERPYAPRRTFEGAIAELRQEGGRRFDPEVVSTLHRAGRTLTAA